MSDKWVKINLEETRKIMFKSNPDSYLILHNVTHFKKRAHGCLLKCDEGIVYFENDDVSHIISDCDDWII